MDNGHYQCLHEVDLAGKLIKLRAEKALDDELMKQTQKCMSTLHIYFSDFNFFGFSMIPLDHCCTFISYCGERFFLLFRFSHCYRYWQSETAFSHNWNSPALFISGTRSGHFIALLPASSQGWHRRWWSYHVHHTHAIPATTPVIIVVVVLSVVCMLCSTVWEHECF